MPESPGLQMFWGDGELEGENPQDFINGVERSFITRASLSETEKVRIFELWLKSGRAAEVWYTELSKEKKGTWESLREAFEERWPKKTVTARTVEELHTLLEATVLRAEDLGRRVMVNGAEEFSHIAWVDKVERFGMALKDHEGLLIPTARRNMPRALRQLVGTQHRKWPEFCKAVRSVSITELEENREFEEKLARIERERVPPTRALHEAMAGIALAPTPAAAPPRFAFQRVPVQAVPQQSAAQPQYRPDSERLVDITRLALPVHPNTSAGRIAYQAQVAQWNASSQGRSPNELRPYPLSPGTVPVASGECWKCGQVGHMGSGCSSTTPVPIQEQKWRSIAASIKRRAGAEAVPVNYVGEDGGWFDREAYDAQVIADYLASQGNVEGPAA